MTHLAPPTGEPIDTAPPAAPAPPREPFRVRVWPFLVGATVLGVGVAGSLVVTGWTPADTQYVHDAYVAWAEPLPDDVAAIAAATGMSPAGELIYRASRPVVEEDDTFNEHCDVEGGAVLGCYYQGDIYVYAVTDERLAGTVEVTAAHEMLHAAYERLSADERARVDELVAAAIAALPEDEPVFEDIALYPPSQLADEWHSRLGTEFADLSPELEAHYARYFDDRQKVVDLNAQSTALFRELQAQIDALVAEIDTLGPALDARIAAYEAAVDAYNADVDSFNARAENGAFTSQAQFDGERNALLARGDALDAEFAAIDAQIVHYNGLIEQLTARDASYAELYSALDSSDDANPVGP